jgi:hypothetical protein
LTRTIVVSDLHGDASLLARALDSAGFSAGNDRLVIAGDLVDIGTDDTIGVAEELDATILAGNHEVSGAIGLHISPQNPETLAMWPELARRLVEGVAARLEVDGWLITRARCVVALDGIVLTSGRRALWRPRSTRSFARESRARCSKCLSTRTVAFRLIGGEIGRNGSALSLRTCRRAAPDRRAHAAEMLPHRACRPRVNG